MQNKDKKADCLFERKRNFNNCQYGVKGNYFFLLPLYTKYLTPEALGVSDTITNVSAVIFPLLVMGLDSAFSAFYFEERSKEHGRKVFNTIWFTLLIASCVPFLLIIGANIGRCYCLGQDTYAWLLRFL